MRGLPILRLPLVLLAASTYKFCLLYLLHTALAFMVASFGFPLSGFNVCRPQAWPHALAHFCCRLSNTPSPHCPPFAPIIPPSHHLLYSAQLVPQYLPYPGRLRHAAVATSACTTADNHHLLILNPVLLIAPHASAVCRPHAPLPFVALPAVRCSGLALLPVPALTLLIHMYL